MTDSEKDPKGKAKDKAAPEAAPKAEPGNEAFVFVAPPGSDSSIVLRPTRKLAKDETTGAENFLKGIKAVGVQRASKDPARNKLRGLLNYVIFDLNVAASKYGLDDPRSTDPWDKEKLREAFLAVCRRRGIDVEPYGSWKARQDILVEDAEAVLEGRRKKVLAAIRNTKGDAAADSMTVEELDREIENLLASAGVK